MNGKKLVFKNYWGQSMSEEKSELTLICENNENIKGEFVLGQSNAKIVITNISDNFINAQVVLISHSSDIPQPILIENEERNDLILNVGESKDIEIGISPFGDYCKVELISIEECNINEL